jgi:hypothetical protein
MWYLKKKKKEEEDCKEHEIEKWGQVQTHLNSTIQSFAPLLIVPVDVKVFFAKMNCN